MGNWRTVNIVGTMTAADAVTLRQALDHNARGLDDGANFPAADAFCLSFDSRRPGLCGLGAWPAEQMNRAGNLHERDYSVEDVKLALEQLVCLAPSMLLKVHCGDDWESDECVATISVGEGLVVIGKPEVERIEGPSVEQMHRNLMVNLLG